MHLAQSMVYNCIVTLTAAGTKDLGIDCTRFRVPLDDADEASSLCTSRAEELYRQLLQQIFLRQENENFKFKSHTKLYCDIGIEFTPTEQAMLFVPLFTRAHREAVTMLEKNYEKENDECKY